MIIDQNSSNFDISVPPQIDVDIILRELEDEKPVLNPDRILSSECKRYTQDELTELRLPLQQPARKTGIYIITDHEIGKTLAEMGLMSYFYYINFNKLNYQYLSYNLRGCPHNKEKQKEIYLKAYSDTADYIKEHVRNGVDVILTVDKDVYIPPSSELIRMIDMADYVTLIEPTTHKDKVTINEELIEIPTGYEMSIMYKPIAGKAIDTKVKYIFEWIELHKTPYPVFHTFDKPYPIIHLSLINELFKGYNICTANPKPTGIDDNEEVILAYWNWKGEDFNQETVRSLANQSKLFINQGG